MTECFQIYDVGQKKLFPFNRWTDVQDPPEPYLQAGIYPYNALVHGLYPNLDSEFYMHLKDEIGITYQCRSFDRDANDGTSQEDFYALLGCDQTDSPEIIKRCFHKQMLIWHPDKNPNNKEYVSTRCQWIADAYKILSNREAKEWWD